MYSGITSEIILELIAAWLHLVFHQRKIPIAVHHSISVNPQELIRVIKHDTGLEVYYHNLLLDGWDNLVLEVNGSLIFRFTRREDILQQHIKELELLPLLNRSLTIRVPNPVYHQTETSPYYMAYKKIHGKPITGNFNRENLVEAITLFLHELQEIDHTELEHIRRYNPDTWKQEYNELHQRVAREVYPSLEPTICSKIDDEFTSFLETDLDFNPVICHRDLTSDHILELDGRITGVIDWGDSCVGDPAFDLTGLLMDFGDQVAQNIIDKLDYPAEYLVRARFYGKMAPIYETLYGLEIENEEHIKQGLEKINKAFTS